MSAEIIIGPTIKNRQELQKLIKDRAVLRARVGKLEAALKGLLDLVDDYANIVDGHCRNWKIAARDELPEVAAAREALKNEVAE